MTEIPEHLRKRRVPPMYMAIAMAIMFLLHRHVPLSILLEKPYTWAGVLPGACGVFLGFAGMYAFYRHKTATRPFSKSTALVQTGVFSLSRNPMYLGLTLILLGIALKLGSLSAMLSVPLFPLVIDRLFIRAEEEILTETFGQPYIAYQKKVRRWL